MRGRYASHAAAKQRNVNPGRSRFLSLRDPPFTPAPIEPVEHVPPTPEEAFDAFVRAAEYDGMREFTPDETERLRVVRRVPGGYAVPGSERVYSVPLEAASAVLWP